MPVESSPFSPSRVTTRARAASFLFLLLPSIPPPRLILSTTRLSSLASTPWLPLPADQRRRSIDRPHDEQRPAAAGNAVGPGRGRRRRRRRSDDFPGHPPLASAPGAGAAAAGILGRRQPPLFVVLHRRAVYDHEPRVHRDGRRGGLRDPPQPHPGRRHRPAAAADEHRRGRRGDELAGHRAGQWQPAAGADAGEEGQRGRGAAGGAAGEEGRGGGEGGGVAGGGGGQDQQQVQAGGGRHQRLGEPANPQGHRVAQQDREEAGGGARQGDGEGAERCGEGAAEGGGEAGVGGGEAGDQDGQGARARQLHEGRRQGAHQAILLLLLEF